MKRIILILVLSVVIFLCMVAVVLLHNDKEDTFSDVMEEITEKASRVIGATPTWASETSVYEAEFANGKGGQIFYYVLYTTYDGAVPELTGVHEVVNGIINPDTAELAEQCDVSGFPAVYCEKNGRQYLCWTRSPEYSFVLECVSADITLDEIFKMAESVVPAK